jgi:hypothetical protein
MFPHKGFMPQPMSKPRSELLYSVSFRRLSATTAGEVGGSAMAKGQVKREKTNKPKLSPKEKKANKAKKQAEKAAK